MDWNQFRRDMDSLGRQIQQVNCQVAPTVKKRLDDCRETLLAERTNYALGSAAYLKRLDELFGSLYQQGCLIPRGNEGAIATYFDELVKHAMIAGSYDVLEKWGIQPFATMGVQAILGFPKNIFIQTFVYKANNGQAPASAPYYMHLAKAFTERLRN